MDMPDRVTEHSRNNADALREVGPSLLTAPINKTETTSTPDIGQRSSDNTSKVPKLMIAELGMVAMPQRRESEGERTDENFLRKID